MTHSILTFTFVLVFTPNLSLKEGRDDSDSIFFSFGILHTLEKLSYWAQKEEQLVQTLRQKAAFIDQEIDLIKLYLNQYEQSSGLALANLNIPAKTAEDRGDVIASSAILAHLMTDRYATVVSDLRRFVDSWEYREVEATTRETLEILLKRQTTHAFKSTKRHWPNTKDLYISHNSLLSIHEFYNGKPTQLSHGVQIDTSFGGNLRPIHLASIGQFGLVGGHFHMSVDWLEFTLSQSQYNWNSDTSISKELVETMLHIAVQTASAYLCNAPQHNRKLHRGSLSGTPDGLNLFTKPITPDQSEERVSAREEMYSVFGETQGNSSFLEYTTEMNALALCTGAEFQPTKIRSRMRCYLERKKHPYLILNPLKTEILSEYPFLVQFYDVLGNDTIQKVKGMRDQLQFSSINVYSSKTFDLSSRTSAGAVMTEEDAVKIRKIAGIITGLVADEGDEAIQVVEYVYGRMLRVHSDKVYSPDNSGNRLATVLYYVDSSTNLIGGHTPFCQVGVAAYPIPGSAVFWFNMFRNGTVRNDMYHSSCPVIHGHKISNAVCSCYIL